MKERNIWVTSDTHFGHENIIQYCGRPFANSNLMDQQLVENWNSVVKPEDIVYHLGDVYMGCKKDYIDFILSRLNGRKRLILGNHDNGKDQILQKYFQKITVWRHFSEFGLLLTHVPVHETSLHRGKTGNEKKPAKMKNVHGHTHINGEPNNSGDYKCVCVELTDYKPVNIEELRII